MSDIAILVENLSKQYRIGKREPYKTLSGSVTDAIATPFRRFSLSPGRAPNDSHSSGATDANNTFPPSDTIWALEEVSFELEHGKVVGVIGRNGAGKSTLLKILSRITEPTKGHVRLRGRVGSLLEVGTGFHVELTGRENIYLSGAILGMRRTEIDRKFDEIVAFSEIEKFLDTPAKRYSSGMFMRLAFSVAAHLEPDILLVDEVLAVGDIEFQRKCLGKLGDVAQGGRTVLFVSHNLAAIRKVCSESLLLDRGQLVQQGPTEDVLRTYEASGTTFGDEQRSILPLANPDFGVTLENISPRVSVSADHANLEILIRLNVERVINQIGITLWLHTLDGILVTKLLPVLAGNVINNAHGSLDIVLGVDCIEQYLAAGDYWLSVELNIPRGERIVLVENIAALSVPPFDIYGTNRPFVGRTHGIVPLKIQLKSVNRRTRDDCQS